MSLVTHQASAYMYLQLFCYMYVLGGYSTDAQVGRCGQAAQTLTLFKMSTNLLRQNSEF